MLKLDELKCVSKPARYIGGEPGRIIKKNQDTYPIGLVWPKFYEDGINSAELLAMYYGINKRRECSAEMAFATDTDFEEVLTRNKEELYTLETKTPLKNMKAIFTKLDSTLEYTTFLRSIYLSNIKLMAEDRMEKENLPVIIVGGKTAFYAKPLYKIIDVFILGDIVRVSEQIMDKLVLCLKENLTKKDFLKSISMLEGVYIPAIHKDNVVSYYPITNMNNRSYVESRIIPTVTSSKDYVNLSLTHGCKCNCNLCNINKIYDVAIPRTKSNVLKDINLAIKSTGNSKICLKTDCFLNYEDLQDITESVFNIAKPKVTNINLGNVYLNLNNIWSLKYMPKTDIPQIFVGGVNEKQKQVLGVDISEAEVLNVARQIFKEGFTKVSLKYIIGIPGEKYEDLNLILDMAKKVSKIYTDEFLKLPSDYVVNIDIDGFYPKPHSVLEFSPITSYSKLENKVKYIQDKNTDEYIKIPSKNFMQKEVEIMLSRGDNRIGIAIIEAVVAGATLDFIPERFNKDVWKIAFNTARVDIKAMLEELKVEDVLPWDNVMVKISKEELWKKYTKIMEELNESTSNK